LKRVDRRSSGDKAKRVKRGKTDGRDANPAEADDGRSLSANLASLRRCQSSSPERVAETGRTKQSQLVSAPTAPGADANFSSSARTCSLHSLDFQRGPPSAFQLARSPHLDCISSQIHSACFGLGRYHLADNPQMEVHGTSENRDATENDALLSKDKYLVTVVP
jgi:hypothetical protein